MLALEVVLAGSDTGATMVFDEVDAGVGGRAAVEIGRRLAKLARTHQVIVVTHLPQVAAWADTHFRVEKRSDGAIVESGVEKLSDEAMTALAMEAMVEAFGSGMKTRVVKTLRTHWVSDPYALGGYSHARPGKAASRLKFSETIGDRIVLAGEHCSIPFYSTVHGAHLSGIAAADKAPKPGDGADVYDVTHSRGVFIFDRFGRARLLASDSEKVDAVVQDLKQLIDLSNR